MTEYLKPCKGTPARPDGQATGVFTPRVPFSQTSPPSTYDLFMDPYHSNLSSQAQLSSINSSRSNRPSTPINSLIESKSFNPSPPSIQIINFNNPEEQYHQTMIRRIIDLDHEDYSTNSDSEDLIRSIDPHDQEDESLVERTYFSKPRSSSVFDHFSLTSHHHPHQPKSHHLQELTLFIQPSQTRLHSYTPEPISEVSYDDEDDDDDHHHHQINQHVRIPYHQDQHHTGKTLRRVSRSIVNIPTTEDLIIPSYKPETGEAEAEEEELCVPFDEDWKDMTDSVKELRQSRIDIPAKDVISGLMRLMNSSENTTTTI